MRISSRAVIIENGKVLTLFRRKIKGDVIKEYYVIPGGGLEAGETLEQNVTRELREELNIEIKIIGYLGEESDGENVAHYFHCEIISGTPRLGGEELERMTEANYYEPQFIELSKLDDYDINAKDLIRKAERKEYVAR